MSKHYLNTLFAPKSVAVFGASERQDAVGQIVFQNMLESGFQGELYPINPKSPEVQGDRPARYRQFSRNFAFFDAPVGMFVSIDKHMGPPQWSDVGMFVQTIMLLAREHGLHTCAQEAWTSWHETVRDCLDLPDTLMVFCGIALGYGDMDDPVNGWRTQRAGVDEIAEFRGFDASDGS
jgi:nitroreductase